MRHHFSQKLNAFSVPGTRTAKLPALSSTFVVREFLNLTGFVIPRRRISKEIFVSFSGLRGGGVAARGRTQRVVECADKNLYVFRTEGIVMLKKATNRHGASSYSLGGIGKIVSSSKIGTSSRAAQKKSDCLAGVVGLELRNVVAKYPFERLHRFPGIQPDSRHRDCSRLSCGV
jgi:hypothetical protein